MPIGKIIFRMLEEKFYVNYNKFKIGFTEEKKGKH